MEQFIKVYGKKECDMEKESLFQHANPSKNGS